MAINDRFYKTLNKLSQNHENEHIKTAIISWCTELSLPEKEKIADYAYDWLAKTSKDTFDLYKKLLEGTNSKYFGYFKDFTKISLEVIKRKDYKAIIDDSLQEIEKQEDKVKIKYILIIAFVLVGVGFTLYFLDQKHKNTNSNKSKSVSDADPESPSGENTSNAILVLVINAQHENLIESLREKNITEIEGKSLYSATQALWMGDESECTQLREWFNEEKSVQGEPSEYDVYLIEIGLKQEQPGFKKSAKSLDRADAFTALKTNLLNIEVSPRLPSKAYSNQLFYNR